MKSSTDALLNASRNVFSRRLHSSERYVAAERILEQSRKSRDTATMIKTWQQIQEEVLLPTDATETKHHLFKQSYQHWDEETNGPPPVWQATPERLQRSNTHNIIQDLGLRSYDELYKYSLSTRAFWTYMSQRVGTKFNEDFELTPETTVDTSNPIAPRWFPDATMNIADSFFQAPEDHVAIISKKEGDDELVRVTYGELDRLSNRVANGLLHQGHKKRDHIAIDMPMNTEAVAAYIGILKMGGTVVSLADSFKEVDIQIRLEQIPEGVKAIFTQDFTGRNPLYPVISATSNAPHAIVVTSKNSSTPPPSLSREDQYWDSFLSCTSDSYISAPMSSGDNINIIFSSSTSTGKEKPGEKPKAPKALPWKADSFVKSATDAHLYHDMQPEKVLCWPTNLGWMVGSFCVAGTLMNRGTLALYDGRPITREFGEFVQDAQVNVLGVVPALPEHWEKTGLMEGLDWSRIERFTSTGSPSTPSNYFYLSSLVRGFAPIIEYMGGTEIGGAYVTCTEHRPFVPSMFNTPALGTELYISPQETTELKEGEVCFVMPSGKGKTAPMGLSTEGLNFKHDEKYFDVTSRTLEEDILRRHGDILQKNREYFQSGGRADDGIKINGIKTSSTEIEDFIKSANIHGLKEVAVVAVRPPQGGEDKVVAFTVMDKNTHLKSDMLRKKCVDAIRRRNPQLSKLHDVEALEQIPLTPTGKIKRQYLADDYLEKNPTLSEHLTI